MSGTPTDLSNEQRQQLERTKKHLREWVKQKNLEKVYQTWIAGSPLNEECLLLKYLRARDFNETKSHKLLEDLFVWRRDFQGIGVDNITDESIESEVKTGKFFIHGFCREGRPMMWIKARLHSKSKSDPATMEGAVIHITEEIAQAFKLPIETTTVLMDFKGFTLECMDYKLAKFLTDMFATKYPESLGCFLMIDAPRIFWACWKIISPWVDPVTAKKIRFIKLKELSKYVDENSILEEYGGKDTWRYKYTPNEDIKRTPDDEDDGDNNNNEEELADG